MNTRRPNQKNPFFAGHGRGIHGLSTPVEKAKDFRGTTKRLFHYFRPFMSKLFMLAVLILINTVLATISPKVLGLAITRLFAGISAKHSGISGGAVDFQYIAKILVILGIINFVNALFVYMTQRSMAEIAVKIVYALRRDMETKLSSLPLSFFDTHPHGDVMSRITGDVENINTTIQQGVPQLISSTVGIAGAAVMMFLISPMLMVFTILTLPLSFGITMFIARKSQKYYSDQQRMLGELNGYVEEMLSGHMTVKAFNHEKVSLEKFSKINNGLYETGWRAQFITGFVFPAMNFVNNMGYAIVYVAGGILVVRQKVAIGDMQAFVQYIRMFTQPVAHAAGIINSLQSAVASAERLFDILDKPEQVPEKDNFISPEKVDGKVSLEGVHFGYSDDRMLFEDLNLEVMPGQVVAIVGQTGAGKTTLVNLLLRFYEIQQGRILIDGVDNRDFRRGELRRMFGMVLQDTWLFHGTIRENIAYSNPGATDDEIQAAAKASRADHFIQSMPRGYDTMINEEVTNVSQGEKQLLTIARALLADPAILILDEATSSVDTRTELIVQQGMKTLMKGRTCFVIAHRLSTIRDAERIIVMKDGRIVEQGRHKELLGLSGQYAELYRAQFSGVMQ